ncbi:esterase family protein [Leifsonia shinshuensis]|uniref:alpha/beta hydrolase n=1 Tax=Leifsonia shinshuensis TaxID=150026 RepID=UPI001F5065C4|nr:alpha/beta hydrolase-fold protein [Leifsonia shinshuensis]MCI0157160.1 esterase family protein [Leifsonia shinshuensis]
MGILAWLTLALGLLAAYPAWRFGARAWRFRAGPTVRAVLIGQVAGLVFILLWCLFAPRPDLGGAGWFAIALASLAVPLALGDTLQSRGGPRTLALALTVATGLAGVAATGLTLRPTLATATIAGKAVPLTPDTLANGAQLTVRIPPTASGFSARDAHLFVPSGWLRDPATTRPVVEMMMGQPGRPTLGATLDALHSLGAERLDDAPFILVVDQIGAIDKNPPCSDTVGGKLDTYLSKDVPDWIRSNLPASGDREDWVIAGYSHGGECAAYLGAKHPDTWANVVDISGPDKPGEHRPTFTRNTYYGGSQAAFEATWPANILSSSTYPEPMTGIFVAGALDPHFRQQVEATATAAEKAGWKVTYWAVPDATHTQALEPGLATAYNQLIGRWLASGAIPSADRFLCTPDQNARACGLTQAAAVAGTVTIVDLSALALFLGTQLLLFFTRRSVVAAADPE